MVLVERGYQTDKICFPKSPSRPICDMSQSSTSNICESISRRKHLGNRCPQNQLDKSNRLCLSPNNNQRSDGEESRRDGLCYSTGSPLLVQSHMVLVSIKSTNKVSHCVNTKQMVTKSTNFKTLPSDALEIWGSDHPTHPTLQKFTSWVFYIKR